MKTLQIYLFLLVVIQIPIFSLGIRAEATTTNRKIQSQKVCLRVEWNATFGGRDGEEFGSMTLTEDGGVVIGGTTHSFGNGYSDMWLVKVNSKGDHEWNTTIGGASWDFAYSMTETLDGGYALAGDTTSYGGETDIWLVKTEDNGQREWDATIGGIESDAAFSIIQTTDQGFALVGQTTSYGAGGIDVYLAKTNATGHHKWNVTFGGTSNDDGWDLTQTSDEGFVLVGNTWSYGAGESDIWLIKTDSRGQHEWNTTLGGSYREEGRTVIQTRDGGFVVTGTITTERRGGDTEMWVVKTNATGHHEWNATYGGEMGMAGIQTSDTGFALIGSTLSHNLGTGIDFWLVKTDSNGQQQWNATFGGEGYDVGYTVIQTSNGEFILAGITSSYGEGDSDFWVIKTTKPEIEELTTISSTTTTTKLSPPSLVKDTRIGLEVIVLAMVCGSIYFYSKRRNQ